MKYKLYNSLVWLFIIGMFFLSFLSEFSYLFEDLQLNPFDYARITDVDYKAVVVDEHGSEGKVVVTERITFDIHAASKDNPFWELWRDLPEDYVDGVKVHYKVNSVKQILEDGTEIVWEESPKLYWDDYDYVSSTYGPGKWYHSEGPYSESNAQYECVFFYVDGIYREKVVFEIEYEMYNAALKYNDCSDLYLALYSGSTTKYLESYKAQILFPNKDMPKQGNYQVYTYGTNANEFPVTESATENPGYYTFTIDLDEDQLKFRPYNEYIEFDLVSYGRDRHIFTEYAPDNYYTSDDVLDEIYAEQQEYADAPALYRGKKLTVLLVFAVITVFTVIYALTSGRRTKLHYLFYTPTTDMQYYRDIPSDLDPNFAAALVFSKHKQPKDDSGIYSAILLSLARKGYISLTEWGVDDIRVTIKKQPAPSVTPTPVSTPGYLTQSTYLDGSIPLTQSTYLDGSVPLSQSMPLYESTPENDTVVTDGYETYEPLTLCEEYYFNLLVRHATGNSIMMSDFQRRVSSDYENTDSFATNIKNSIVNIGVRDGYFQSANYNKPRKKMKSSANFLMFIGIVLVTIVNLISRLTRMDLAFGAFTILGIACIAGSIFMNVQSRKYVLLTQFGEDEYAKWRGLYNFLNSDTLIHERTVVELPLWEKYLVYATAFGLSEKIIKAIGIRCPETTESEVLNNNTYRSGRLRHRSRSFRSSVRSGSYTARSGGGGGFGYGGGGRGGGGGGGGH